MICWIYRSPKKQGMYLYCQKRDDFSEVPQQLMQAFGQPEFAMHLDLTSKQKLAREDIDTVKNNLDNQGYHLQMPPPPEELI